MVGSYADFITLLFAFFVVMFATSQTDKARAQQVSDSVKKALEGQSFASMVKVILGGAVDTKGIGNAQKKGPGGEKPHPKFQIQNSKPGGGTIASIELLTKELEQEIKAGKLQVSMGIRGITISFAQVRYSHRVRTSSRRIPTKALRRFQSIDKIPNPARLEGHTDAIPIHTSRFRSNWELSAAEHRAA